MTFPDPSAAGNYFWPIIVKVGLQPRFNKQIKGLSERAFPNLTKGNPLMASYPFN